MTRLCVFCGSTTGVNPVFREAARALATELLARRVGLVYGGGATGLMGALADAMLAGGGEVVGVIPRGLMTAELAHAGLSRLHVVDSMHERKALMTRLADGFVALPGGLGTLEETLEVLTWAQLGIHRKPVGLVNVAGYWDDLLRLLGHAVREGFVRPEYAGLLLAEPSPARLLDQFAVWSPPALARAWLGPAQI
jgi:uncharacterized protein (TIGR00730 family)